MRLVRFVTCLSVFLLVACGGRATATPSPSLPTALPTSTIQPVVTQTITASPVIAQETRCEDWQAWPIIPTVSQTAHDLYQRGQTTGNNSHAFSKVGDGEISAEWFFSAFDRGGSDYDLGPHQDLRQVIDHFHGSFSRVGMAARRGFNTQRILDPSLGDPSLCESHESPLACELRLQRPSFAILSLGTNQVWKPEEFEAGMRQILDFLLSQNVVPILSTKGDNLEGDHRINRTVACLAEEYDLPLWNFWSSIQSLPNHGLQLDLEHLTYGIPDFADENALKSAWTVRNLTALQALDAVWRSVALPQ